MRRPGNALQYMPRHHRQFGDVRRDATGFVPGQPPHIVSPAGFVLVIEVTEDLALRVADLERFPAFLDGPGRREAAGCGHVGVLRYAHLRLKVDPAWW